MCYYNFPSLIRFMSMWWTQSFSHWPISYSQRFSLPTYIKHVHFVHFGHSVVFLRTNQVNIDESKTRMAVWLDDESWVGESLLFKLIFFCFRWQWIVLQWSLSIINVQTIKNERFLVTKVFSLVSHFSFSNDALHQRINQTVSNLLVRKIYFLSIYSSATRWFSSLL